MPCLREATHVGGIVEGVDIIHTEVRQLRGRVVPLEVLPESRDAGLAEATTSVAGARGGAGVVGCGRG